MSPALLHDGVVLCRTMKRLFKPQTIRLVDGLKDLLASLSSPGLEAVTEHLPQGDPERPNIGSRRKFQEGDAFGSAPVNKFEQKIFKLIVGSYK